MTIRIEGTLPVAVGEHLVATPYALVATAGGGLLCVACGVTAADSKEFLRHDCGGSAAADQSPRPRRPPRGGAEPAATSTGDTNDGGS